MSNLNREEILFLFKRTGALLEGHFELSSGLHSPRYLQCAKVLQHPTYAFKLCQKLTKSLNVKEIDVVIGAATGGIIISFLMSYFLGKRSIFAERREEKLLLRRGLEVKKGEKVLVMEDVITTGQTVLEMIELVKQKGGEVAGIGAIVNRSKDLKTIAGFKVASLLEMDVPTYKKKDCPLCEKNIPITKPGSKK